MAQVSWSENEKGAAPLVGAAPLGVRGGVSRWDPDFPGAALRGMCLGDLGRHISISSPATLQ